MKKIFLDTEFTGLHKGTTLISIGLVSECGKEFYAELTDYDRGMVDPWIQDNVIKKLQLSDKLTGDITRWETAVSEGAEGKLDIYNYILTGPKDFVSDSLRKWFAQFGNEQILIWSDCLAYDWVLFCDLFGHAFNIPENILYIPFDLATVFQLKGIDPDISREGYAYGTVLQEMVHKKHTALYDAKVIRDCYFKLMKEL